MVIFSVSRKSTSSYRIDYTTGDSSRFVTTLDGIESVWVDWTTLDVCEYSLNQYHKKCVEDTKENVHIILGLKGFIQ